MRPILMMAPRATSWSASCESLDKVSITVTLGLERCSKASATGTARRSGSSPYWRMWSRERIAISEPTSSPIAIIEMPRTAAAWWKDSLSSRCSVQVWSIFCTCSTSPEFAKAKPSTVSLAYFPTGWLMASNAAKVASTASCWPKYNRPRPSAKKCGHTPLKAPSTACRSMSVWRIACATSSLQEETKISPRLTAAIAEHSIVHAVSTIVGVRFSMRSSRQDPA
mmetsp:Transcript_76976/g.152463  ORF Transcript_76976/g.152463 Transcript_76976/m.152463 type:complete len:224 (+) Transcript_76976:663-1334(+)